MPGNAPAGIASFAWPVLGKERWRLSTRQGFFLTALFFVGMEGSRLFDFSAMARLDGTLSKVGRGLGACRAFFLPGSFLPECPVPKGIAPRFLTRGETAAVRKTRLFPHALARESTALTLAGFEGEAVAGVAAAVVDSAQVWQIGVDVRPQSRGKGLGCFLVVNLTKEVLIREILPVTPPGPGTCFQNAWLFRRAIFPLGWRWAL